MARFHARLATLAVAGALMAPLFATPAHAEPVDLEQAVAERMTAATASTRPDLNSLDTGVKVEVTDKTDDWAFGTVVVTTPRGGEDLPEGRLFLARLTDDAWQVELDGEPAFRSLSAEAPVLSDSERTSLGPDQVTVDAANPRTQMRLPWATGQTWTMTGGPHPWGSSGAWSSLDFAGGDQAVRATRAGNAYTMCTGWIRVVHANGFATDYYHLWSNINTNGGWVGEGAFLGYTGTDVTCGGSATGRHVHFGLRYNNVYDSIHAAIIGKWVIMNGGSAYSGSALHGSTRAWTGGGMYNYGPLWADQGIVDANGGGSLNKRSGPGTGYGVVGSVAEGATVTVSCSQNGTTHTGRWGTTAMWNRLSDGTWISDAYLMTGASGPVSGWC
ncbi:peptidoglycan DD-metalloendopeptidase family protein [Stackebrandtia albiflava]